MIKAGDKVLAWDVSEQQAKEGIYIGFLNGSHYVRVGFNLHATPFRYVKEM